MTINHGHQGGDQGNPGVEFDKSDLGARNILIFFVVLAVFAVCVHLIVLGLYAGMTRIAQKHEAETSPLAPNEITPRAKLLTNTADVNIQRFPEPRLLTDDTVALTNLRLQESQALAAPSRLDAEGNVHPSIDEAMKEVVSRLPVRSGEAVLPDYPGVGRKYSLPNPPDSAAIQQDVNAAPEGGSPGAEK